jgi:hypothetical protein
MINRSVAQIGQVTVLDNHTFDASCGVVGTTAGEVMGLIVDRVGLGASYRSAKAIISAVGDIGTTTADAAFIGFAVKMMHSSTTCNDDFNELSTASRKAMTGLFIVSNTTATSTGNASGRMTTDAGISTSTGSAVWWGDLGAYDLGGAQRFLSIKLMPNLTASSSGGGVLRASGTLALGDVDEAPPNSTSTGIGVKTSA